MIEKFEIKSHDGPGRIGKLKNDLTPRLFFKNELLVHHRYLHFDYDHLYQKYQS